MRAFALAALIAIFCFVASLAYAQDAPYHGDAFPGAPDRSDMDDDERPPMPELPSWCKTKRAPQVQITPTSTGFKLDHGMGKPLIAGEKSALFRYRSGIGHDAAGITQETLVAYPATISFQSVTSPDGKSCLWFDKITIDVKTKTRVDIARENGIGTCLYRVAARHAKKHGEADKKLAGIVAQSIALGVQDGFGEMPAPGPYEKVMLAPVKKIMDAKIREAIKESVNAAAESYTELHDAVDQDDADFLTECTKKDSTDYDVAD